MRGALGHQLSARQAALLILSAIALLLAGCGGGTTATPAALRLEREDFLAVSRGLMSARPSVDREVTAAKAAWPLIANGIPADTNAIPRAPIATAETAAAAILAPPVFAEGNAASLTGSAAKLAGMFNSFSGLAERGWHLTGAAIEQIEHGTPVSARFARGNAGLYIESIYDGHFILAQVGKQVRDGYRALGGPAAFGAALTQAEVDTLADAYSEANDRLHPHVGVRVGS